MSENPPVPSPGFWYMAGPYTDDPLVRFGQHLEALYFLSKASLTVYSPIINYHELAMIYDLPKDADFWHIHNYNMITPSNGVIVVTFPKWEQSKGVKAEILHAQICGLPVWSLIPPTKKEIFSWKRLA